MTVASDIPVDNFGDILAYCPMQHSSGLTFFSPFLWIHLMSKCFKIMISLLCTLE